MQESKKGKDFFNVKDVFGYFFRKKTNEKVDVNLKMMHVINRIAIIMFLVAMIIWIVKRIL